MPAGDPVNEAEVPWEAFGPEGRFELRRKRLARAASGSALGCSLIEVPPGRTTNPYHCHLANEEAFFVLAGTGKLRLPTGERALKAGDYVALPAGRDHAHQIRNDAAETLRLLALSTMREPDVVIYPDSNKVYVVAGSAPGAPVEQRTLSAMLPLSAEVDYWHGERDGEGG